MALVGCQAPGQLKRFAFSPLLREPDKPKRCSSWEISFSRSSGFVVRCTPFHLLLLGSSARFAFKFGDEEAASGSVALLVWAVRKGVESTVFGGPSRVVTSRSTLL